MKYLILFILDFITIYLLYLVTVVLQNKKMKKFENGKQVQFFVKKYGLNFDKISINKFINILALTNSLIMSITLLTISLISNILLKMLVAFVLLFSLLLIGYSLLGKYIMYVNRKEGK